MLTLIQTPIYDNYRMPKQAISVTLSPDNLLWLKGRARAAGAGSLSECLDGLLTKMRFGGGAPRPAKSMRETAGEGPVSGTAIPDSHWRAWQSNWDELLAGVDLSRLRGRRA
jgi:hypothetical protein